MGLGMKIKVGSLGMGRSRSITAINGSGRSWVGVVFFSFFFLMGAAFFYVICVNPVMMIIQARNWAEAPAVVRSSEVEENSSSDGSTYRVKIEYNYEFQGREYESDRYSFFSGSTSGRDGKQDIVDRYPLGFKFSCYVDPNNPAQAVINRELTAQIFWGLIPLIFVVVGLGGMYFSIRGKKKGPVSAYSATLIEEPVSRTGQRDGSRFASRARGLSEGNEPAWLPDTNRFYKTTSSGELSLSPLVSPMAKVVGSLFICLFWNGIVSVFAYDLVQGFIKGETEWGLALFLLPFLAIGLGLFLLVFYLILSLRNPRPTLFFPNRAIYLGEPFSFRWELSGKSEMLHELRISVKGQEEAKYRRGTSTYTDKNTFFDSELSRVAGMGISQGGDLSFTIPADSMHSFRSRNNSVVWNVVLHGDIKNWPDLNESFPLVVLPKRGN